MYIWIILILCSSIHLIVRPALRSFLNIFPNGALGKESVTHNLIHTHTHTLQIGLIQVSILYG